MRFVEGRQIPAEKMERDKERLGGGGQKNHVNTEVQLKITAGYHPTKTIKEQVIAIWRGVAWRDSGEEIAAITKQYAGMTG